MHDVKIDGISVRDDWGLILTSAPEITPPEAKTNILNIPGADGAIDLTSSVRGYPVFQERTGSLTFVSRDRFSLWNRNRSRIMEKLQGLQVTLRFDDDPGWYWSGALNVREGDTREKGATVTIDYRLFPYKHVDTLTTEPWLWDPFSLVDGVIYNGIYTDTSVDPPITYQGAGLFSGLEIGTTPVELAFTAQATEAEPQSVKFAASGGAVSIIVMNGATALKSVSVASGGEAVVPGLVLYRGKWLYLGVERTVYALTASGTAALSLSFRPGRL
jgi:hypothetical protein